MISLIFRRDERSVPLPIVNGFVGCLDRDLELGGRLLGCPPLRAHTSEKLSGGESAALERQLPAPGVRAKKKIRVVRLWPEGARQFRHGVGMLVLSRRHDQLVVLPNTEKALMPWSQFNPLGAGCLRTWRWLRSGYTPSAHPRTRGERDRSSRSRAFWRERDVHFDKAPRRRRVNCCDDLRDVWLDERPIPLSEHYQSNSATFEILLAAKVLIRS